MDDLTMRVLGCFRTVFAGVPDDQLEGASTTTLEKWDSVASITLVNVIEEEFQMEFDYDAIPELTSFQAVVEYLKARHATNA